MLGLRRKLEGSATFHERQIIDCKMELAPELSIGKVLSSHLNKGLLEI